MTKPYTYIFIRTDLSYAQQIVQAAHTTLEAGRNFECSEISSIVLFGVNDENELLDAGLHMRRNGIKYHDFYEPDIGQFTALASEPLYGDDRESMQIYKTYRTKADMTWKESFSKRLDKWRIMLYNIRVF